MGEPAITDGICEMTLEARDPRMLAGFYTDALGMQRLSEEDDRIWLACGQSTRLGLWRPGEKEFGDEGGRHVHFALSVSPGRLDDVRERLVRLDVAVKGPVEHEGGDRSLYAEDPEGNVLELWDFFERRPGREDGVGALA
jgi:catechol-2,3-dioxygenase